MAQTKRRILTGEDVRGLPEGGVLELPEDAILTDVAREWIESRRIRVVPLSPATDAPEPARLIIGSDHRGLGLKRELSSLLAGMNLDHLDCGTHSEEPVDYPDIAHQVALGVALGHARKGIVLDGSGIGSAIAANKVPGVRAAVCHTEAQARSSREHNDANVLTLDATSLSLDALSRLVSAFLTASPSEARHRARVRKIGEIEKKYYRPI